MRRCGSPIRLVVLVPSGECDVRSGRQHQRRNDSVLGRDRLDPLRHSGRENRILHRTALRIAGQRVACVSIGSGERSTPTFFAGVRDHRGVLAKAETVLFASQPFVDALTESDSEFSIDGLMLDQWAARLAF